MEKAENDETNIGHKKNSEIEYVFQSLLRSTRVAQGQPDTKRNSFQANLGVLLTSRLTRVLTIENRVFGSFIR